MITFLGDVFPVEPVELVAELPGTLVLNLEAPLTDHKLAYPGKINLRGSAAAFRATFSGRDVVATLANNHCMDFHEAGLHDTFSALEAQGVAYCGAGTPDDNWLNPVVITVQGLKVALLAYADASSSPVYAMDGHPGAAPLSLQRVVGDIATARSAGADRVVVIAHWGEEQVHLPSARCIGLGRAFIDAGADVVVGHHAHCIQSYEAYRGKPIMYGLGNCIFPGHRSPSFYDADGRPTRTTNTRPAVRNRQSLALSWQPMTGAFEIRTLFFSGDALRQGEFSHRRFRLRFTSTGDHELAYARAYRWGKVVHALENYFSEPKVPRLTHIKNVTRILRTNLKP